MGTKYGGEGYKRRKGSFPMTERHEVGYPGYPYNWRRGEWQPPKPAGKTKKNHVWHWLQIGYEAWIWKQCRKTAVSGGARANANSRVLEKLKDGFSYLTRYSGRTKGMVCERCCRGILKPHERRCPEYTEEEDRPCPILERYKDNFRERLLRIPHMAISASEPTIDNLVELAYVKEYARWCVHEAGPSVSVMTDSGHRDFKQTTAMTNWLALENRFALALKASGLNAKDMSDLNEKAKRGQQTFREALEAATQLEAAARAQLAEHNVVITVVEGGDGDNAGEEMLEREVAGGDGAVHVQDKGIGN